MLLALIKLPSADLINDDKKTEEQPQFEK